MGSLGRDKLRFTPASLAIRKVATNRWRPAVDRTRPWAPHLCGQQPIRDSISVNVGGDEQWEVDG